MDLLDLIKSFGLPVGILMIGVWGLVRALIMLGQGTGFVSRFSHDQVVALLTQDRDDWKEEAKALAATAHDASHLGRAVVQAKTVQTAV